MADIIEPIIAIKYKNDDIGYPIKVLLYML